ncbi:MAG: GIY-YIG nuclease family protein [Ktedonobacteraceae bacterium]
MSSDIPQSSGIYRITCAVNGKIYIGSAVNIRNRWLQHHNELRHKKHPNQKMQNAWDKYG